jgi:hypothetical protein
VTVLKVAKMSVIWRNSVDMLYISLLYITLYGTINAASSGCLLHKDSNGGQAISAIRVLNLREKFALRLGWQRVVFPTGIGSLTDVDKKMKESGRIDNY